MKHLLIIFSLFTSMFSYAGDPLSVVVVGGGPVGLFAAIEARDAGAEVLVLEKRPEYTRRQHVFLYDKSIQLLESLHVTLPSEYLIGEDSDERIAVIPVHALEEVLEEQAIKIGVNILKAEFEKIEYNKSLMACLNTGESRLISYDLLVAADGANSRVRNELKIPLENYGKGEGTVAWLLHDAREDEFEITDPIVTSSGFIRRIKTPGGTLIFSQGLTQGLDELLEAAIEQNWHDEAQMILDKNGFFAGEIPLSLQQIHCFSDPEKSVIFLGDAAATGSYFLGLGLNTGFEMVGNSKDLFQKLQSKGEDPYPDFEVKMKEITDSLIDANRFLFVESEKNISDVM